MGLFGGFQKHVLRKTEQELIASEIKVLNEINALMREKIEYERKINEIRKQLRNVEIEENRSVKNLSLQGQLKWMRGGNPYPKQKDLLYNAWDSYSKPLKEVDHKIGKLAKKMFKMEFEQEIDMLRGGVNVIKKEDQKRIKIALKQRLNKLKGLKINKK
jgi:hypothetical protein|tara:strand:- start:5051 stop:5527 length:477 start_codon:yes stop_codon:yes gene_type:complete